MAEEIVLHDTSTPEMIAELRSRHYSGRPERIIVYGDPAGLGRTTAASKSDYQLLRLAGFRNQNVAKSAPLVKDRVQALNARLLDGENRVRLFIHPDCKKLIRDLEQVKWKDGTTATLDKSNSELTHATDALGYFIHREYPLRRGLPGRIRLAAAISGRK